MNSSKLQIPIKLSFTQKISNLPVVTEILIRHINKYKLYDFDVIKLILEYYVGVKIVYTPYSFKSIIRFVNNYENEVYIHITGLISSNNMLQSYLDIYPIKFYHYMEYDFTDFIICNSLTSIYKGSSNIAKLTEFVNILKNAKNMSIYDDFKLFITNLINNKQHYYNINPSLYLYIAPIAMLMK